MRRPAGISLLELILALGLLFLLVIAVLGVLPGSMLAIRSSEARQKAECLAQSILEERRAAPFETLQPAPSQQLDPVQGGEGLTFRPTIEIVSLPGASPGGLREVRVEVTWEDASGSRRVARSMVICDSPR